MTPTEELLTGQVDITAEQVDVSAVRSRGESVQVILRAVDVLWALRAHPEGQTLPELARTLSLARPTVHRIVNTLSSVGFVSQMSQGRVRLGSALAVLGAAANTELSVELHPYLKSLSQAINESVMLAMLEGEMLMCMDFIAAPQSLQAVAMTGMPLPLYCTAIGKALLPQLTADEFARLIPDTLRSRTANTITTRELLAQETQRIKEEGVALDREEYEIGICGLGASVSCPRDRHVSIGVLVPSVRFYGSEERLISELKKTRDLVRSRLGAT